MAEALPQGLSYGTPGAGLQVTLAVCQGPRQVTEYVCHLAEGATVRDALLACRMDATSIARDGEAVPGVWGRPVAWDRLLEAGDRVELYRPLLVDPKVARRERFSRQGARGAGLFARQRPGGKAGY